MTWTPVALRGATGVRTVRFVVSGIARHHSDVRTCIRHALCTIRDSQHAAVPGCVPCVREASRADGKLLNETA
jgi:hypothetical protein